MKIIETHQGRLHYTTLGSGPDHVLLFHGFGQNHQYMLPFTKLHHENYTFHLIDLFYHGRSQWFQASTPLSKNHWKWLIQKLMQQESFTNFHLIGYSMGGKFSLLTYELFPDQVKSLTLLAPDGIKTGAEYSISSYPTYFHPFFKRIVFRPQLFFGLVAKLNKVGIVENSLVKFITTQMKTRSQRAQVYFTWRVFGEIHLDLKKISRNANKLKTPISLFTGAHDRMISPKSLSAFSKKIPTAKSIILPVGHGGLINATSQFLNSKNSGIFY
ncbi:alpha/beta fold hydrolase [Algoriphagus hitonicola]|uniref:Pimeloyl-ACP methyl ester carboxylesterase n=1 Tax=Algoriphagus hitonicola TaxID=435880 RepID=A0A1I2PAG7_9BACT|nr:alpha/beta hydrolase [Algoriphagus hitonicola]SFG10451.1 Pimeloyl-ACP methyl ester carboxylesterase [Algoriphagus hitonicola]